MKYSKAVDYLNSKVVLGIKPSLDRIQALCSLMGNPQKSFDAIQVTGTNGKTSVSHMTAGILVECGFKTGLYISPHLETVRERISIGGKIISVDQFSEGIEGLIPLIRQVEEELGEDLSYFEVVTALAFKVFNHKRIDVAVLEVGLGGRWDATNVVDSEVAVLTNVEIDHVKELGNTREKIAAEKAGIIKEGSLLITAEGSREILMILAEKCERLNAEMKVFGRDFRIEYNVPYIVEKEQPAQFMSLRGLDGAEFQDLKIPMIGKHQAVNAACAVAAAQAYTNPRNRTDAGAFKKGLEKTTVPGRVEIFSKRPLVVGDGAHNAAGADRLISTIDSEFGFEKLVMVLSILDDKDARAMIRIFGAIADDVIVTRNRNERAIDVKKLVALCRMENLRNVTAVEEFKEAVRLAYKKAGSNGMICITGSLYTVTEARILYNRQKDSREMKQDR